MSASPDSPPALTRQFTSPPNYSFPHHRLNRVLRNSEKQPIVLVACGSFSPVTYLHLRMFEMAVDYVRQNTDFEILGGYLSPVSDQYKKPGLLSANHRVNMCTLATEETSEWLMVDPWEAFQEYQRTAVVLDHFEHEINTVLGGVHTQEGERRDVRVMLLAGSDLISTMSEPGVWSEADLDHILGKFGTFIVERAGSDMDQATEALARWRHNIFFINQLIQNDVSSTKVRLFLRRGLSVRYLLPAAVVRYIEENRLYLDEASSNANKEVQASGDKEREGKGNTVGGLRIASGVNSSTGGA
ncbi:Nucleotidylyl transferase [Stereum hirsutum FP-91666 SS1]|uniref:Nucleotidylyl transferase n=1 Tax=Stereum hirsutum (strain FP-91666) TaxID=721885 RepID=UPI000444A249|nr:Nucleotidylyl transferase [Stereum hirsutum FP-91666 SS1]EIM80693.1 Nucleotidylyl transferase [Stereum hirsutum FP-91666 SS1]